MLKFGNTYLNFGGTYLTGYVYIPSFDEVTIGTQTWMSVNLSIDDGGEGITKLENVTANGLDMGTQYYYTYDAAVRIANKLIGWHLPTDTEWNTLRNYAGGQSNAGTKLKSKSGWDDGTNGTDNYGFTSLPAGYVINGTNDFIGGYSSFWSSTDNGDNATSWYILKVVPSYFWNSSYAKTRMNSIRLIKD